MSYRPLPIGIEDFSEMIRKGYYYVDKTPFIKELLDMKGKVNLFTRPRRFGKTLNMSMLRYYFEDTGDREVNEANRELFSGLAVMGAGSRYEEEMGSRPVISLSFKSAKQPTFEMALESLMNEIIKEFNRHDPIKEKGKLLQHELRQFCEIQEGTASRLQYAKSLDFLSHCLDKIYGKPAVLLIDEYDVPLENAWFVGFYDEMSSFLRSLLESALKTNLSLDFAVLTGCLRITKESIFTGLNNLETVSILNHSYSEYFGFTQAEVDQMLKEYGQMEKSSAVMEWYDGYRFGTSEVYNPWSVINYVKALRVNPEAFPVPYWANTSSNSIVKQLVERADLTVRDEIENLIAGGSIEKKVHEEIGYEDIDKSEDNLWNFLFFTGYLKQTNERMEGLERYVTLMIPNLEVSYIYRNTILEWFGEQVHRSDLSRLYQAIEQGDVQTMEEEISAQLQETISFYDSGESYYHGFLAGLLKNMKKYRVLSNRESGAGRADLILKTPGVKGLAVVFELKAVKKYAEMESGCEAAVRQIEEKRYDRGLMEEGYTNILKYGICFYRKECMVRKV